MGSLLTHKNIHAPLTPYMPEGQIATRQERERNPLRRWVLGLRKDAGKLGAIHLLGHTPPPPL